LTLTGISTTTVFIDSGDDEAMIPMGKLCWTIANNQLCYDLRYTTQDACSLLVNVLIDSNNVSLISDVSRL